MATSILHIKSEVECHVYLFDEDKGIATPGKYFNLEVRKGEQELLFVSTKDETVRCRLLYEVEEHDTDYRITIARTQFKQYTQELLDKICLAEQGDASAQYNLGVCYKNGEGVEQDYEEAVKWYRKAAEQGDASAQNNLGVCYKNGEGVEQDYEEAVKWYRKAAEQGDASAQYNLGVCYDNGRGLERDYEEAVKWYRKAAEQGDADAQLELGKDYEGGWGVVQNYEEAVEWYRKAAEQEDAHAQYNLGECYKNGRGVEQDYEEAVKWYRKAAEQGNVEAQYDLGECYKNGEGVEQDYEEAVKWYCKAAEQGDFEAQNAVEILDQLRLAEQGIAAAQYNLGRCYAKGNVMAQDDEEAVKWYRKAAEQGHADAQLELGMHYKGGWGVDQDHEEAVKWIRNAAEQGNADAQYILGRCYENGRGVDQDYEEAVKWYEKAAEQGHYSAQHSLENLMKKKYSTKPPYYLFFDTETTGVPLDYNAPASNTKNWPRLVQLGWILTDENGKSITSRCEIVKPDGFVIPADAARVHGITTQKATREGKPLGEVIDSFLKDARLSKIIVGHNISFDQHIVGAELIRLGIADSISEAKSICTMEIGTDFCKILGSYGYKWPTLQELYRKLFGTSFEDAHDAMADITATKKCFFEMKRLGLVT